VLPCQSLALRHKRCPCLRGQKYCGCRAAERATAEPVERSMPFKAPRDEPTGPDAVEEARRLRLHQRILRDFGRIGLEDLEIGSLLQRAVAQAARATGVRHTKIMRYRTEQGDLLAEAGIGWRAGMIGKARFGIAAASPPGRALQTGQPVVIDDIRDHPEFGLHPVIAEHGIVSLLNVPIRFDGNIWGTLEADSEEPGHFDDLDAEFLEAMAALVAGALQRREGIVRAEAAAAEVAVRAERRGMLLRELQHRAKNNLALVAAMLSRERRTATAEQDARAAERLGRLMQRVTAVALAQDRLSSMEGGSAGDGNGTDTDLAGYLRALLSSLDLSLGGRVVFEADLESCVLPFERRSRRAWWLMNSSPTPPSMRIPRARRASCGSNSARTRLAKKRRSPSLTTAGVSISPQ
jgi:two-component system, sensor histidine kinase PdtaS